MPIEKLRPTATFDADRLAALRAIAPEAFADGKLNRDALLEALGEHLEDEGRDAEHFGLFWPGKREARRLASTPSAGALHPAPGEGVHEETTRHVFIEGDNLEVLKLLQKAYAGRVKLIYIDPPYNTGNDFIYNDHFAQPVEEYLRATGQADEAGRVLVTNTQAGGRYHSNWLNMMYPRLRLARNLLRDDGVIFVSIDDNEVHNLRALMNEVFGEENFVANVVWQKKYAISSDAKGIPPMHDSILVYQRSSAFQPNMLPRTKKQDDVYQNPDNDPRGLWRSDNLTRSEYRERDYYPIKSPKTGKIFYPPKGASWRHPRDVVEQMIEDNRIWFGRDGNKRPVPKRFLSEVRQGVVASAWWPHTEAGHNDQSKKELQVIFGGESPFDTPKPTKLVRRMLQIATGNDSRDIVLDFFSGSCTTAHAVLAQNREADGNCQFIMVQLPELTPADSPARRLGFDTIADVGKERIRRVIARMEAEDAGKLTTGRDGPEDLGFRVFKLGRSNYQAWRDYDGDDLAALQTLFDRFESPLVAGWEPAGLLTEVMLMEGFPLDSTVEPLPEFTQNRVTRVSSDLLAHRLYVCLDAHVHPETIAAPAMGKDDTFICLDAALTDEAKVRLEDGRRVKVI